MPRRADCDQLTADESSFGEKSRPPRNRSCQEERRGEARERDRGAESESGGERARERKSERKRASEIA